jgi:glyoxylate carboligase
MATIDGSAITAQALKNEGVDTLFFLTGGPITPIVVAAHKLGVRCVDVRHEQAAAMAAHAYTRVTGKAGICITASGPGTTNAVTGIANAFVDCCPVITLGGASPAVQFGRGGFQEIDQLALMRPITKWAERVIDTKRIPEIVSTAFRHATTGKPGPAYIDLPKDTLDEKVEASDVVYPAQSRTAARPGGDPNLIKEAAAIHSQAERPCRHGRLLVPGEPGVPGVRGAGQYTLLHHAPDQGDCSRRPCHVLPGRPLFGLQRGRRHTGDGHPLQLHAGLWPGPQNWSRRQSDPSGHRRG